MGIGVVGWLLRAGVAGRESGLPIDRAARFILFFRKDAGLLEVAARLARRP